MAMAKRRRRVSARRKAALKVRKGSKRGTTVRRKATKRAGRKTTAKKLPKRVVRKKPAASKRLQKPAPEIIEDTIIDIIEQPAPGVTVVTELEAVRTIRPSEGEEGSD